MRPSWAVFYCVKQHLSTVWEWSESVRKCLETVVDLDLMLVVSTGRLCSLNLSLRRHLVSSIYCKWQRLHWTMLITFWVLQVIWEEMEAVYKSGTGTRGRGHRDACVGTWDLGTRGERLEDIKYGTRGRVGRGRGDVKYRDSGDAGCEWLLQKSEVNASLSSWICFGEGKPPCPP